MSPTDKTTALVASIAAIWEDRLERIADVTQQVQMIHDKLIDWGWGDVDHDELDHATICYSRACSVHECCEWLPFDAMPNWEDDLYCLLIDEDRWIECIESNKNVYDLAKILREEHELN